MRYILLLVGLLLFVGLGAFIWYGRLTEIPDKADQITMVFNGLKPDAKQIQMLDEKSCDSFLSLLRSAKPTSVHKCGPLLDVKVASGFRTLSIQLLPGHDPNYYEFILNGEWKKFDRKTFFEIPEIAQRKSDLLIEN